jgi:hypothetical protein
MHSRAGWPERCLNKTDRALGRDAATRSAKERPNCDRETRFLMDWSPWFQRLEARLRGAAAPAACWVRPMEEARKSSLSYRPAVLPKSFVPSGCASIGIIAAPLSESLFVKRWP